MLDYVPLILPLLQAIELVAYDVGGGQIRFVMVEDVM